MARREHAVPKGLLEALRSQDYVLATQFAPSQTIASRGKNVPASEFRAKLARVFALFGAVDDIEIERRRRLQARTDGLPAAQQLAAEIKAALTNVLGRDHPALDAPGLRPHGGKRKLTSEQEVKRQVKKQDTMKRRGYLTKAQKRERTFRGNVTVTVNKKAR
ncbi:MAG: hypothetical protein ACYDCL_22360 [Myxococcales bacterium]